MAQAARVDERGRIKLSKEIVEPGSSVVIIDAENYFLGIPIQKDPLQSSGTWMKSSETVQSLKKFAEDQASKDGNTRVKRRRQI
jgi:hypothetical protein